MAGNNQRNGIAAQGLAHGLRCIRLIQGFRDLSVGARLSRGNVAGRFVDLPRERAYFFQIYWNVAKILRAA